MLVHSRWGVGKYSHSEECIRFILFLSYGITEGGEVICTGQFSIGEVIQLHQSITAGPAHAHHVAP